MVATFRANGRESKSLIVGASSLPPSTAREPFYVSVSLDVGGHLRLVDERTGGQKSSCISTTSNAGLKPASGSICAIG